MADLTRPKIYYNFLNQSIQSNQYKQKASMSNKLNQTTN